MSSLLSLKFHPSSDLAAPICPVNNTDYIQSNLSTPKVSLLRGPHLLLSKEESRLSFANKDVFMVAAPHISECMCPGRRNNEFFNTRDFGERIFMHFLKKEHPPSLTPHFCFASIGSGGLFSELSYCAKFLSEGYSFNLVLVDPYYKTEDGKKTLAEFYSILNSFDKGSNSVEVHVFTDFDEYLSESQTDPLLLPDFVALLDIDNPNTDYLGPWSTTSNFGLTYSEFLSVRLMRSIPKIDRLKAVLLLDNVTHSFERHYERGKAYKVVKPESELWKLLLEKSKSIPETE